jgi:hypothetical protein
VNARSKKRSTNIQKGNICRVPRERERELICAFSIFFFRNFFFFKSLFFAQHNSSKLPMNHVRIFLALSNRESNDTASPQQPKPSLASFDAEFQSGWMEAVGSWLFV